MLNNQRKNTENIELIHVPDLVRMILDKTPALMILDANSDHTRAKYGVIPGSRLLTSDDNYNCVKELPANMDAVLVFYCADLH